MAVENFTTYTEEDDNNKLTVIANKATGVDVDRDENVYLYKDKGADHFDALDVDFEIYFSSNTVVDDGKGGMAITNTVSSYRTFATTDIWFGCAWYSGVNKRFMLQRGCAVVNDWYTGLFDTPYYCTLRRTAGSNSVALDIYSDSARTNKLDTVAVSGFGTVKWQYVFGFVNDNASSGNNDWDGYIQNLDLNEEVAGQQLFTLLNEMGY